MSSHKGGVMLKVACRRLLFKEEGQDLIEWALLASFIAIIVVVTMFLFRDPLLGMYQGVLDRLNYVTGYL